MSAPEFHHRDMKLRLEATKDHFDTMAKGANLLLVAHGAALVGCITFFKEQNRTPIFGGLTLFVFIFGTGFILAICGYALTALARMNAVSMLFDQRLIRPRIAEVGYGGAIWFLIFSELELVAAVFGMIFTVFGLK